MYTELADRLESLAHVLREERADLGIAWDGDGDRVGVVDQEGVRYEADWLTALLARPLLKREPGARILLDYKVSSSVIGNIAQHGGQPALTRTGYSTFRRHMRDEAIAFGGEASGHIVFGDGYQEGQDYPFIDDGVYAACALADYLSRDERPLSAHFADLRPMATSPELRLPCPDERKGPAADAVGEIFSEKNRLVSTADGARIEFDDGWALVRGSNTNPYLSVRFEAGTLEAYEQIRRELRDAIGRQEGVEISDDFGLPAAVGPQRLE